MKKKLMIFNIIFISICVLLLAEDFYYVIRDGAASADGVFSSDAINVLVMSISFIIGLIFANSALKKNKSVVAISIMVIAILSGVIGANVISDMYNESVSDVDWFSDGIN